MRRTVKAVIALLCVMVMLVPTCVYAEGTGTGSDKEQPDGSPSGNTGGTDETTVTYSYIEFGSYPQTEIVSQAADSGVYGKTWATESDCIIDDDLYNELKGLADEKWDANGDTTASDGNKYRRIKKSDATGSKTTDSTSSGDESSGNTPTEADTVSMYFNWSDSTTYHYFKYEPIKWRILEQDGSDVFLLSEKVLDDQVYHPIINEKPTWAASTVRSWLNGYGASANLREIDYAGSSFIETAFTSAEQSKIKTTTIANKDNTEGTITTGENTADKIFLLSDDETYGDVGETYGFSSKNNESTSRQAMSSTYAKAMGTKSNDSGYCYWWLRTAGSHPGLSVLVRNSGSIYTGGQHANSKSRGIRPAMHITVTLPAAVSSCSYYSSLSLNGNINFSMKNLTADFVLDKLTITVDGTAIDNKNITVSQNVSETATTTELTCVIKSMNAKNIGDSVQVVVSYDGVQIKSFNYSIREYCKAVLDAASSSEEQVALCNSILDYVACADTYFNSKISGAVNSDRTVDFSGVSFASDAYNEEAFNNGSVIVTKAGVGVSLGSNIALNFRVKYEGAAESAAELKEKISVKYIKNNIETSVDASNITVQEPTTSADKELYNYIISINNIDPSEYSDMYTLTIDGDTGFELTYGIYTYCLNVISDTTGTYSDDLKNLCKSIYCYGEQAKIISTSTTSEFEYEVQL